MRKSYSKSVIGSFAAASFLIGSTAATAATSAPTRPDPLAVLAVMSGGAPAATLCGAAAAAAAQASGGGCVLPQVDAPPAVAQNPPPQVIPVPPPEVAGAGFGISPLILGLVAIIGGVGLYFALHGHGNNQPVSPA